MQSQLYLRHVVVALSAGTQLTLCCPACSQACVHLQVLCTKRMFAARLMLCCSSLVYCRVSHEASHAGPSSMRHDEADCSPESRMSAALSATAMIFFSAMMNAYEENAPRRNRHPRGCCPLLSFTARDGPLANVCTTSISLES